MGQGTPPTLWATPAHPQHATSSWNMLLPWSTTSQMPQIPPKFKVCFYIRKSNRKALGGDALTNCKFTDENGAVVCFRYSQKPAWIEEMSFFFCLVTASNHFQGTKKDTVSPKMKPDGWRCFARWKLSIIKNSCVGALESSIVWNLSTHAAKVSLCYRGKLILSGAIFLAWHSHQKNQRKKNFDRKNWVQ